MPERSSKEREGNILRIRREQVHQKKVALRILSQVLLLATAPPESFIHIHICQIEMEKNLNIVNK
jgi:hypothetical protein